MLLITNDLAMLKFVLLLMKNSVYFKVDNQKIKHELKIATWV